MAVPGLVTDCGGRVERVSPPGGWGRGWGGSVKTQGGDQKYEKTRKKQKQV